MKNDHDDLIGSNADSTDYYGEARAWNDDRLPLSVEELIAQIDERFGYKIPVAPDVISPTITSDHYALRMAYAEGQRSVVDYLTRLQNKKG